MTANIFKDYDFIDCLREQMRLHPSAEPQDLVKLCYQAAFGAEHLLTGTDAAKRYLDEEFSAAAKTSKKTEDLYELISPDICRVNIYAWKERGLPREWLFKLFAMTASARDKNRTELFMRNLQKTETLAECGEMPFSSYDWREFCREYLKKGIRPIRHSERYRINEMPAYRVVASRFTSIIPSLESLAKQAEACFSAEK